MAENPTVFQDEIYSATDLNRRPGYVLDQARDHAVTILRNNEAFALLPREQASRLVEAAAKAGRMVELVVALSKYRGAGQRVPAEHPLEWLNAFDGDELRELLDETTIAFHRAQAGDIEWHEFDAVLHEWQESAWAVGSSDLAAAFTAPAREVPLTQPPPDHGE